MTHTNSLHTLSLASLPAQKLKGGNWLEAMADAWGEALDRRAAEIEQVSDRIASGDDRPATVTQMSSATTIMSFTSNAAHTAITAGGETLKTMAQKS